MAQIDAQYGEPVDVNLCRDKKTGIPARRRESHLKFSMRRKRLIGISSRFNRIEKHGGHMKARPAFAKGAQIVRRFKSLPTVFVPTVFQALGRGTLPERAVCACALVRLCACALVRLCARACIDARARWPKRRQFGTQGREGLLASCLACLAL